MSRHIGIDLGTANTLAYVKGKGIVLREPSVVAIDEALGKVIAIGTEAKEMVGKTPVGITASRPLKDGVIAEFELTKLMLKSFVRRLSGGRIFFFRPNILVCIPYGVTEVERMAVEDAALESGARTVALIEEPVAAAIGSDINVDAARGSLIVDIGGGTTEVAVISLGGTVVSESLRVAGDKMDDAIVSFVRRKYGMIIGESTAESIKKTVGSVHRDVDRGYMDVMGRNASTGLPMTVKVTSKDTAEALKDITASLVDVIRRTLEKTPPELSGDIYDDGVVLAGGGALIGGLDRLITDITGLPARVAKSPLDGVIRGIGKVIDDMDKYRPMLHFIKYK